MGPGSLGTCAGHVERAKANRISPQKVTLNRAAIALMATRKDRSLTACLGTEDYDGLILDDSYFIGTIIRSARVTTLLNYSDGGRSIASSLRAINNPKKKLESPDNSSKCRTMLIGERVEFRPRFDGTVVVKSLRIYGDLFLHEQRTCSGTVHSIQTLV
jgi:hypothetical protein